MVAGISGGMSAYIDLLSTFQTNTANKADEQNKSFEALMNDTQYSPDIVSNDDIEAANGNKDTPEKNSSDMDLNRDGTITIDEIMTYMKLQMQESMKENLETSEMQGENNSNNNGNSFYQGFKTPISQVVAAYSAFQ